MQVIHTIEGRYQTIFRQYHFYINFFCYLWRYKNHNFENDTKKDIVEADGHKQKGRKTN